MSAEDVLSIIKALPTLIIYVVPGYLLIWVKSFILSEKRDNTSNIFLKSIVISYILIIFEQQIINICNLKIKVESSTLSKFILIILSLVLGYLWGKFITSDKCKSILRKIKINKTFTYNIWDDLTDLKNGLWINVYLPNERIIYQGKFRKYEDKYYKENYYMVISNYLILDYDGKTIEDKQNINNEWVAINTKDISRIELLYKQDSKVIEYST